MRSFLAFLLSVLWVYTVHVYHTYRTYSSSIPSIPWNYFEVHTFSSWSWCSCLFGPVGTGIPIMIWHLNRAVATTETLALPKRCFAHYLMIYVKLPDWVSVHFTGVGEGSTQKSNVGILLSCGVDYWVHIPQSREPFTWYRICRWELYGFLVINCVLIRLCWVSVKCRTRGAALSCCMFSLLFALRGACAWLDRAVVLIFSQLAVHILVLHAHDAVHVCLVCQCCILRTLYTCRTMHTRVTWTLTFFVSLMLFHLSFLFGHVVCIAEFLYSFFKLLLLLGTHCFLCTHCFWCHHFGVWLVCLFLAGVFVVFCSCWVF